MIDGFNGGGPRIVVRKGTLINRTGQALSPGELVSFNIDLGNVAGQAMAGLNPSDSTDGAAGYVLGAAIIPTTANIRFEMAVVDDTPDGQDVPDNQTFTAIFSHPDFPILLEGSSGIAKFEYFRGTDAAYYGTGLTVAEVGTATTAGAASVFRLVGKSLEAGASGATATRKRCQFWGGLPAVIGTMVGIGAS